MNVLKNILFVLSRIFEFIDKASVMWSKFKRKREIKEDVKTTEEIKKEVSSGSVDELNKRWGWKE